jgi:thioredoxin 1
VDAEDRDDEELNVEVKHMAVIHLNQDNFEAEALKSATPVIIDFWASWCGPCQMMGPVFEKLSVEYEGKLKFCKVDTEDQPDLSADYEVRGIPCLVIMNKGKEVDRTVGYAPKDTLRKKIDEILLKLSQTPK